uniref:Uncharacterized protein n=1 Tax=Lygus hesperus TaxID=30085 RepID=A0A146LG00_LYGHE
MNVKNRNGHCVQVEWCYLRRRSNVKRCASFTYPSIITFMIDRRGDRYRGEKRRRSSIFTKTFVLTLRYLLWSILLRKIDIVAWTGVGADKVVLSINQSLLLVNLLIVFTSRTCFIHLQHVP